MIFPRDILTRQAKSRSIVTTGLIFRVAHFHKFPPRNTNMHITKYYLFLRCFMNPDGVSSVRMN